MRLSSIFALAVLGAVISACGGSGGGGGGSSVSVNPPPPTPNPALTRQGLADPSDRATSSGERISSFFTSQQRYATELQDKPATAAAMRPRGGSVTQSSNGRGGVTLDSVDVSIADGRVRATNNGRTLGDVALSLTGDDIQRLFDIGLDNEGLRLLYINTASLGSFGRFAAWGVWIDVPRNAGVRPTVGAFADADSASYFPQSRLSALTGTASYTGTASALYLRRGETPTVEVLDVFNLRLNADFGDSSALGTVSGTLSAGSPDAGDVSMSLGTATIGSSGSGFFTGSTSGTITSGEDSASLLGQWGGQFLSARSSGGSPSGIIGTFGGATADGSQSVIGSFQSVAPMVEASIPQVRKNAMSGIGGKRVFIVPSRARPFNRFDSSDDSQFAAVSFLPALSRTADNYPPDSGSATYIHNTNHNHLIWDGPSSLDSLDGADLRIIETRGPIIRTKNNGAVEIKSSTPVNGGVFEFTVASVFENPQSPRIVRETGAERQNSNPPRYRYADFLTYGEWIYSNPETGHFSLGVFAGGDKEFSSSNIQALTGTATYQGRADGLYSSPLAEGVVDFVGASALTADFGTDSEFGTVSGSISSSGIIEGQTVSLTLGSAPITATEEHTPNPFFTGTTSASFGGTTFTGNWGGSFYNDGAAATDHPGAVSGTFGATSGSGHDIIGTFGAFKQ